MVERKVYKMKLCIHYQRGRCHRQTCPFAHGNAELCRAGTGNFIYYFSSITTCLFALNISVLRLKLVVVSHFLRVNLNESKLGVVMFGFSRVNLISLNYFVMFSFSGVDWISLN